MSNIWFSSDLHANHPAVMKHHANTRRGKDCTEMTFLMLESFNSVVKQDDHLYLIGDIAMGGKVAIEHFLQNLNGKKYLVLGNHDYTIRDNAKLAAYFEWIRESKRLTINKQEFNLSHEPKAEWVNCHKGAIHLHGHLHGNKTNLQHQQKYRIMDVGVDARSDNLMVPWSLEEILEIMSKREIMTHHDHVDI